MALALAKDIVPGQIKATDAEIDRLVYELYGLTAERARIIGDLPLAR